MKNNNVHIRFDQLKLESIGFNHSTICELIDNFSKYLSSIEADYLESCHKNNQIEELSNLLHKLEGAMQYLALTGPLDYIYEIKLLLKSDTSNIRNSILNLFEISHKTIDKMKLFYKTTNVN